MSKITEYTRAHPVGFTLSIIGVIAIAVFAFLTYTAIVYGGKVKVMLYPAPSDAQVLIDGKVTTDRTVYLEPKKYTITASKDGYEGFSKDVYLEKDQGEASIALSLDAKTDTAKKEKQENTSEYLTNEGIAGKQANADGQRFRNKNPIVSKLPFKNILYTIGYRSDTNDPSGMSIIIEVDANEGRRGDVIKQIERWGYDPTELNIQFRNYENPFNEK